MMPPLHALVLVFVPEVDWEEMGEEALYCRINAFYHDGTVIEPEIPPPHSAEGRVAAILPCHMFRDFLSGDPSGLLTPREDDEPVEAWARLPWGTRCFAIITSEGQWIETFEAEAEVLLREKAGRLVSVNAQRPLTRLQAKWRHFVAVYARERPDEVAIPCDAYLRLTNTIDLARATESRDIDAIGS